MRSRSVGPAVPLRAHQSNMKTDFSFLLHIRFAAKAVAILLVAGAGAQVLAQNYPITPNQRAVARQTAQTGVPLSELAPNAPDQYTVRSGDTLWAISRIFLRTPWRWPELWGMNLQDIRNPHLIYPGQVLYLDKSNGRARLSTRRGAGGIQTIKVSPRTRYESLAGMALPTLNPGDIEPFLSEPIVLEENTLVTAPRIVAGDDNRVLLARGDRAYARGEPNDPLVEIAGPVRQFRVFRSATPLKDPVSGEVLGYEAQYLGKVQMARGESTTTELRDGKEVVSVVPATVDVVAAKEEIRAGDRLLPEPPRQLVSYAPRAPSLDIEGGRIISVYGNAVNVAAQNQVVSINKGARDGLETGNVLAILTDGETIIDRTGGSKETLKLPSERSGLLMVFRTFDKVSYGLILEINRVVRAGDRLVNP